MPRRYWCWWRLRRKRNLRSSLQHHRRRMFCCLQRSHSHSWNIESWFIVNIELYTLKDNLNKFLFIKVHTFEQNCLFDMCITEGNLISYEQAVSDYANQCQLRGITICDWRNESDPPVGWYWSFIIVYYCILIYLLEIKNVMIVKMMTKIIKLCYKKYIQQTNFIYLI